MGNQISLFDTPAPPPPAQTPTTPPPSGPQAKSRRTRKAKAEEPTVDARAEFYFWLAKYNETDPCYRHGYADYLARRGESLPELEVA